MISYELDLAHPGLQALGYVHCTGRVSVIVSDDNLRATKIGQACAGGSGSVSVPRSPHDWSAGAAGAETVATKCRDSMLQAPPGLSMPATCGRLHTLELQRASLGAACSNMQWDPYTTDADAALAEAALGMAGRTWARLASSGAGSTLTRLALWGVEGMDLAQAAAAAAQAKQLRWLLLIQEPTAPTCVLTEVCAAVAKATGWVYGSALRARLQDAEARQPANAFLPTSPHKESTVSSRWQDGAASPRSPRAAPQGSSSQAARGRPRSGVELGSAVQAGQGSPWPRGSPGPAKVSALCSPRSNKRTLSTLEAERGAASASAAPSAGLKHGPPGICAPNAGGGGVLGEGESWHSSSRSGATGSSSSSCSSKILAGSDTTCVGLLHRTCSSLATLSALRYLTLVLQGVRACQAPTARAWSAAVADPASPLRTLTQIKALELGAMEPRSAAAARAAVGGMLPQLSDLSFVVLVQGRITRVERAANMSYV